MNPIKKFSKWYQQALEQENGSVPSACCFSTNGLDGYPNARFVSLKELTGGRFVITGAQDSRKGEEVTRTPRGALTLWWPSLERQVRVQGDIHRMNGLNADRYFRERPRKAQIIAWASKQGKPMNNPKTLKARYDHFENLFDGTEIPRPANWTAMEINPVRIEFLEFKHSRLHKRKLYVRNGMDWTEMILQP